VRSERSVAFAVVALMFVLPCYSISISSVSAQSESLQLVSSTYYIVQGQSDLIAGDESINEFSCLKILTFDLPYNMTRVYSAVPSDARNVTAWVASKGLINTSYGWETSGEMAGDLFVDVPSWFDREAVLTNTTNSSQSILASGSVLTNASYDSGALHLNPGATDGGYLSAQIPVPESINIVSANLTMFGTDLQNVTSEISNDQGTTWITAPSGTETEIVTSGTSFHVRLLLSGNETTPRVTGFQAAIRYVPVSTTFTVHLTYVWPTDFQEGKARLDLEEPVPYVAGGSSFVFLYLEKGYSPEGTSITLNLDEDGDSSQPTKVVFVNMTFSLTGSVSRSIEVTEPKSDWTWLVALVLVGAALSGGTLVLWRRKSSRQETVEERGPDESEETTESQAELAKRKADLISRKKEISTKLDELTSSKSSKELTSQQAVIEAEALRSESKRVRNELNRVSKKIALSSSAVEPAQRDDPYDSVLASIARIDEDFEKGRLPENTYRSLRKEYVSRAAGMLSSRDAAATVSNPLEREKTKLMEAIVVLEEEHAKGELDSKVYDELRSSYRKELAEIMRKIEES